MKELFERNGIYLTETQLKKFEIYAAMIKEYNEKFNLTSITDDEGMTVKHFVDSLKGIKHLPESGRIADIGAGAGFPSIPLCIITDGDMKKFTLIDSVDKKVGFLNAVIKELDLKNACAVHTRIEDEAKKNRGYYDCVVARAVAPLGVLCEYALPVLRCGGRLVAYKSEAVEEVKSASNALKILGGSILSAESFMLDGKYKRSFIIVEKLRATPLKYPRGQNKPRNNPL